MPAQNMERGGTGGIGRPQQERLRSVIEMMEDYVRGVNAMNVADRREGVAIGTTRLVVTAVAINRLSLDDIDARANRRKGWAKSTLIRGLNALWGVWSRTILALKKD